jgi:hypothetical protein
MKAGEEPLGSWKSYEEVATCLLNHFASHFGLERVERKQKTSGLESGTEWEIDAKGVREGNSEGFVVIECRRHTRSRQSQEQVAALAYRILDTGAAGGIWVSPLGLEEGALKVAASNNIIEVKLNANCAVDEFVIEFLNRLMGVSKERVSIGESDIVVLSRDCRECGRPFKVTDNETICPKCAASK